jgi:CHAT domain-containing protein
VRLFWLGSEKTMKKLLFLLLIINSISANTQTIKETAQAFWEATDSGNNPIIVEKGELLIFYYEKNKLKIDSTLIEIRIITANGYSNIGNYTRSLELELQTLEIMEKVFGKEHPSYALSLNNIALDYSDLGDNYKALDYNLLALKIREKIVGKEHSDYALSLNNIASTYLNLGDYNKALEYNLLALEIREKVFGKEHPDYANSLNNLANNYLNLGNYNKSLEYNLLALKIREKVLGKEHPNYANSLDNTAVNYHKLGDYNKALEYNLLALKIKEKVLGKKHPRYALSIGNLAFTYSTLGNYNKALEYNLLALEIYGKIVGKEHPSYALSLNNIAIIYSSLGDYNKALGYNILALEIREKAVGKEHPDYAWSLSNIGLNYMDLNNYNKAVEYNLLALKIREKAFGKEHPDYALSIVNLAFIYLNLGDYNKALEYNLLALKIREKAFGKEHPDYAWSLNNIGVNYTNLHNYNKALEYNLLALKIREKVFGKEHRAYALSLNNIAVNYLNLGNYKKALEFNLLAHVIYEKVIGKEHPDYALSLNNIAFNYADLNQYNKALQFLTQSLDVSLNSFSKNKFGLTPAIQSSYKKTIELSIQHLASLSCIESSLISTLHDKWLGINGMIGSDQNQLRRRIELSDDRVLITLFDELTTSQFQLVKYNELSLVQRKEKESQIILLEKKITELQSKLNNYSIGFSEMNHTFSSRDEVNNLKYSEVLVDIMRFPFYDFKSNMWSDSIKYLVFISSSKDSVADYVYFHKGKELEEINFENYKYQATNFDNKTELKDTSFYNSFWKPIAEKIGDAKTIYVSLGGVYNNINLNTIYNPTTGKYLIEEKDIRIVNSARDFVLSKESEKKNYTSNTASLFGFPNFDGNTTVTADTSDLFASTRDLNSFWLDSLTRGGMKAKPLPATKTEVENISSTLKSKGWQVNSFLAENASETNIKKQESPRILHVATHGYFFQDIPLENNNNRILGMDRKQVVQDPMLRSGLLLTGANKTLKGEPTTGENGLLSAAEASLLDLRETELVVLSACETGKGEIKNSEGVYGLRKAFADAGAQNIIMSLWKVDDKVTKEFMSRFYEIWLNDRSTIREAFNKTQLEIKANYPEPYYWGAFILVGE